MPIEHLALVTEAIQAKISGAFTPGTVDTTAASPLDVTGPLSGTGAANVVSVFLFHIAEDPMLKNQANTRTGGIGDVPIRQIPLALNLYYVINGHNFGNEVPNDQAHAVHDLLGIAAKTLHDNPVITVDDPETPTPGGNQIEIILRPVTIEESVQFWASDEHHLIRPSIYIEARVVFIVPQAPQTIPGIVLSVNSPALVGLGPQLASSRNTLAFDVPKLGERTLPAEPARVALFDPSDPTIPLAQRQNNLVTLKGSGLGAGSTFLDLSRGGTTVRLDLLNPQPPDMINSPPLPTPAWVIAMGSSAITLRIWTSIFDVIKQAPKPILPGTYTARFIDDTPPLARSSNEIAFSVVPQIKSVTLTAPGSNTYTIVLSGTYIADSSGNVDIQLVAGDEVFVPNGTSGPGAGKYLVGIVEEVVGGTTVQYGAITFQRTPILNEVISKDRPLPVTLLVNGATATPAWITEK